jgi:hypothetical protein
MARQVPSRPSLEQLKRQAKDLLKAHQAGDRCVCEKLRLLRRFAQVSDERILAAAVSLQETQHALAVDYGFRNWSELKRHVEAVRRQQVAAEAAGELRVYAYRAYGPPGAKRVGTVAASDLDDALWRIREEWCLPIEVTRAKADEAGHAFRADQLGPPSRAPHAVSLLLYEAVVWGWCQAEFDCTGPEATLGVWYEPDLPPPSPRAAIGHRSDDVLSALRAVAGDASLGSATAEHRRWVTVGRLLPDAHPQQASLAFRSKAADPGRVFVAVLMPGPEGVACAPHAQIVDYIVNTCEREGTVHVLTAEEDKAEQLATALSNRLGADAVGLVKRNDKEIPGSAVVVSMAAEMCFIYMRARMAGPDARAAMERGLAHTTAICVDVSREHARTPCEIRNPDQVLLARMDIAPFIMLYGQVIQFEEEQMHGDE